MDSFLISLYVVFTAPVDVIFFPVFVFGIFVKYLIAIDTCIRAFYFITLIYVFFPQYHVFPTLTVI